MKSKNDDWSDELIAAWAERNDVMHSPHALREMFEDAATCKKDCNKKERMAAMPNGDLSHSPPNSKKP